MRVEAAVAERPLPGHGDDRAVLLTELGLFAVFDGAGQPFASEVAARTFTEQCTQAGNTSPPHLSDAFSLIQARILNISEGLPEDFKELGGLVYTTGTAINLSKQDEQPTPTLDFAHAGDSSLYLFDHDTSRLRKISRDDWIDNFLGSERHLLEQAGSLALPTQATVALFSDGIGSQDNPKGISEAVLASTLSNATECQDKAERIVAASRILDDATVIVVDIQT